MALRWDKLSPEEFQQLQDLAEYSNRQLQEVLDEFCAARGQSPDGDIDYEGFRKFLDTFLDVKTPDELSRHLFLSFVRRPPGSGGPGGAGGCDGERPPPAPTSSGGFVGRLQGLTERLHLSHHRSDSDTASRSRTGSVHPVLTVMHTSYSCQDVLDKKTSENSPNHSQMSRNSSRKSNNSLLVNNGKFEDMKNLVRKSSALDVYTVKVSLKDIVCYLSLLEAGRPEDKLEFMFRLYDTDGNGVLDTNEMDCIVNQMMAVAEYLGWDVSELRPILKEMMVEIDYDADGTVSLEEWKRGGLTTIPLLVLLGLDTSVAGDGEHAWRLKHFSRPAYCNLCLSKLVGLGKKGLCCIFCKYTVHERCVQRAPSNCIQTHAGVRSGGVGGPGGSTLAARHHWVEGNCRGRCARCRAPVKGINGISGMRCRWCQILVHNRCCGGIKNECSLGPHSVHVLPPSTLCPRVLDRQRSLPPPTPSEVSCNMVSSSSMPLSGATTSALRPSPSTFQVCSMPQGCCPLLVFVNPKSGGRQGARLMRKFQYILNPRQVHDLSKGGPTQGLAMFKDVQNFRVICCGGDGTVGWVLETMDKTLLEIQPAVGVIPLGTGNDLARCLRWGGGYEGESLHKVLDRIQKSSTVMMDRWQIEVVTSGSSDLPSTPSGSCPAPSAAPYNIINNYFSIGVDAAICVKFHVEREKNPDKFSSRMKNKLWYFEYATTEQFAASCKNLQEHIDIVCDGVSLDLSKGSRLQGIALLNIPFAHGGSNLWGDPPPRRPRSRSRAGQSQAVTLAQASQDIGDKLIEVVGLENCLHMGQVRTGLRSSGQRLAQCKSITIVTRKTLPMQIDGEPWMQPPCQIIITHKNQVPMLMAPPPERSKSFLRFFPKC